jgi:hypothetical protein
MKMTLEELRILKAQWLEDRIGWVKTVAHPVIMTYGKLTNEPNRPYRMLIANDLHYCAHITPGPFNVHEKGYQATAGVIVYGESMHDKDVLCRVSWTNFGEIAYPTDDFIVPGAWMDVVNRMYADLLHEQESAAKIALEKERQVLMAQLKVNE